MMGKYKQCLSYECLFRKDNIYPPHDETTWVIEVDPAGARVVDFAEGFIPVQIFVQCSVTVNFQELHLGTWPVDQKSTVLCERFGVGYDINLEKLLKKVEKTEETLAFCVELLNVQSLSTIMPGDLSERSS
jgi:hypothetical protein